ncbi:Uncharacterised protein [Mycobacteroides abscessus subsp. abscessus]|uniref:hypothetical protein n=1 Tax=Mycobacteroides abscessus TaxID=36809 RepID=UPI0009294A1F|nr:hypothetical protein [Mycobacteroides abscessus]SHX55696.1 Uncharacterised protein [Mycobacteroides abscessus subsp. abscessus]SHY07768.1 Uncharacterised protein [Mycobacteroides abscessus subsp. abscessus]SIC43356.1 Uncharacterised protein [Mycobacteroides abscessus subsp. abscessus]SID65916.1 Uncharacterised protein [Mycobacteroides abscessus subsp. abscessus]SIF02636.1 Uncharacterised protein [Mycobacteroides abscessus subsp. abscessus]
MSEAQKVVIQVLEEIFATWIDRDGVKHVLVDGGYDGITGRPIADVAAEVDEALGGLTKVWSEVVVMDDGYTYPQWNEWYDEQHHAQKAVYDNPGTVLGEAFVSGWTVTE